MSPGFISRWFSRPLFPQPLSEVENGVKPYKPFWSIRTQLICCIEDFNVFAGNWALVLWKEINPCRARSFVMDLELRCRLEYISRIMENGFLWREPEKKSVQPGTNWLLQCCDCMVFLALTSLASA